MSLPTKLAIASLLTALALTSPAEASRVKKSSKAKPASAKTIKKDSKKSSSSSRPSVKSASGKLLRNKIRDAQTDLNLLSLSSTQRKLNYSKLVKRIGKGKLAILSRSYVDLGHPSYHEFNVALDGKGKVYLAAPNGKGSYVAIKLNPSAPEAAGMLSALDSAVHNYKAEAWTGTPSSFKVIKQAK